MTTTTQFCRLFLCCVLLSACTHTPKSPQSKIDLPAQSIPSQSLPSQEQIQKLTHWEVRAKVTVERRGEHYSTAYLNWQQQGDAYHIDITSPFGDDHLQITSDGNNIQAISTAADGSAKRYRIEDIDTFILKLTGLKLPIQQLQYWIKGAADPKQTFTEARYDDLQHLIAIDQQDWHIQWDRFTRHAQIELPHKIKANQEKQGTLKVTVIVADWKI
jgi:outer membrane lipoprotein LolB